MSISDLIHFTCDNRITTATIIRTAGNIETKAILEESGMDTGRRRIDPLIDYEIFSKFPSTSGIVMGDLILANNTYYLTMAIEPKFFMQSISYYKVVLYECNSIVAINAFNDITKKMNTVFKQNIPCLITLGRLQDVQDDKALVIRSYTGKSSQFHLYIQELSGLKTDGSHIIIDQNGRRFKVGKLAEYFIANGIIRTPVVWENK